MKLKSLGKLSVIALSLFAAAQSQAVVRTTYLANARPIITFNELTPQERLQLAQQTQIVLRDLYVNRYQKVEFYGTNPTFKGHVDPAVKVQELVKKIDKLSTTELHSKLSQIFLNQRDLHLNYIFPLPHAAFLSFLPFDFARTSSAKDDNEVRINRLYASFFDVLIPGVRKPQPGDLVLEYDGVPIVDAVNNVIYKGAGANPNGGFTRALNYLTLIPQSTNVPPSKDKVTLKLRAASNGEEYTITVPWLVQFDDAKVKPAATASASFSDASATKPALDLNALTLSNELGQETFNNFLDSNNLNVNEAAFSRNKTAESSINWAIVPRNGKNVGYISISTFSPAVGTPRALTIIANLLRNQLASTDALVIDVRNNGGGNIIYADQLPQLFIPNNAKVGSARLLNTKVNFDFLNQEIFKIYWPDWVKKITDVQNTNKVYSATGTFTSSLDANLIGQVYYKPVGVLMNARSYSATDLFTCQMKDNFAATIYGEDRKTGAGGANVLEYGFFNAYQPEVFKPLPGGVSMRVSWRQSVRNNYNNELIEDHGCSADVYVPRSYSDMLNGDQTQFDKIADNLLAKAVRKSGYSFPVPTGNTITVPVAEKTLKVTVSNTELVKVYANNKLLKSYFVSVYGNPKTISINLPAAVAGESYQLAIVGTDGGSAPLWNTKRVVNVVQ